MLISNTKSLSEEANFCSTTQKAIENSRDTHAHFQVEIFLRPISVHLAQLHLVSMMTLSL
jgi:hypothetical protein